MTQSVDSRAVAICSWLTPGGSAVATCALWVSNTSTTASDEETPPSPPSPVTPLAAASAMALASDVALKEAAAEALRGELLETHLNPLGPTDFGARAEAVLTRGLAAYDTASARWVGSLAHAAKRDALHRTLLALLLRLWRVQLGLLRDDTMSTFRADLALLLKAGTNYVRGAHYPQDQRWLDRLDEHGVAMWEETLGARAIRAQFGRDSAQFF